MTSAGSTAILRFWPSLLALLALGQSFGRMRDALNATGRPVVYSLSNWGGAGIWRWAGQVAHAWRTGIDLFAVWDAAGTPRKSKVALIVALLAFQPLQF